MSTMNISLPDPMRAFVEEQVKQKGYSTASEYIRHLIRTEQENVESKRVEALLLEGLDSGEKIEISDEWWEKKREELRERLREDKS
ncbi:MAG: type II toxin-antitoxin system ParD family antitoxin [Cyanobacteria bacterium J06643_5]